MAAMILRDFQIYVSGGHLSMDETRRVNIAAFPVFERVRLSLKQSRPKAPFQKVVIELTPPGQLFVWDALGICTARVPTDLKVLLSSLPSVSQLVSAAQSGMREIQQRRDFSCREVDGALDSVLSDDPPCSYRFDRLGRQGRSGVSVEVWFLASHASSRVEVRFVREQAPVKVVTVVGDDSPLYLEDRFPVKRSRIRNNTFELLDRSGAVLGSVPLPIT